jgi:hypothetical protein
MRGLGGYIILKIAVVLLGRKLHGLGGREYWKVPSFDAPPALKRVQLQPRLLGGFPICCSTRPCIADVEMIRLLLDTEYSYQSTDNVQSIGLSSPS